ncbi:hypothetical protein [Ignatzschineria cameli]|uniref:Uncharacterized protein n=1 Tax=Ignatzschineria cameli TaxID=2182793 RepID=A0A2U2ASQ7_9GAMM|nr:hypothetical protein [Ignatzschineria cameli]PWD86018.1 hypothetical protein DC080_04485 [Ignatzschineria cameli]PWD87770.1 hypothetical protein DC077_00335 [Ignatzschineria cameli]PWD89271.1 hypothetical protein DC081_09365 [Ignatzschineria cameli]PWD90296.1 hypothetical protein DC079_03905 [Ignatzschineria cameli]PWD92973.1 hypothetical protein DC078_03905 [Ignatzschineria cameli]
MGFYLDRLDLNLDNIEEFLDDFIEIDELYKSQLDMALQLKIRDFLNREKTFFDFPVITMSSRLLNSQYSVEYRSSERSLLIGKPDWEKAKLSEMVKERIIELVQQRLKVNNSLASSRNVAEKIGHYSDSESASQVVAA